MESGDEGETVCGCCVINDLAMASLVCFPGTCLMGSLVVHTQGMRPCHANVSDGCDLLSPPGNHVAEEQQPGTAGPDRELHPLCGGQWQQLRRQQQCEEHQRGGQ